MKASISHQLDEPEAAPGPFVMTSALGADGGASDVLRALRHELYSEVVRAFNASGIAYCILGTGETPKEGAPDFAGCDMDFAVRPQDREAIPALLASAAGNAGAHLVQAIEHESTATYFVIARQYESSVAFLHPDCTTDYRRQRRLWLRAEELLAGRRLGGGGFFRPAPARDFIYYLIKQVLKQSLNNAQWHKLVSLQNNDVRLAESLRFWPAHTAPQMEWALLQGHREWFQMRLTRLLQELQASPYRESRRMRAQAFLGEVARIVRRVLRPTGVFVRILGGTAEDRLRLARALAQNMAPAFRRAWVLRDCPATGSLLAESDSTDSRDGHDSGKRVSPLGILRALLESTLVVSAADNLPGRALYGGLDIQRQKGASDEDNLAPATSALIAYLSRRTARRLRLQTLQKSLGLELSNAPRSLLLEASFPEMSRILLSAYACEPDKGSEPGLGWMWATHLAVQGHDVWVITRTANQAAIECALHSPHPPNLHFVYCDLPRRARGWKKFPGALYLYYFVWQWLAYRQARRLHRVHRFDCVHHVTFVSLRAPSFMGWLGIPFVFGPVSGGERVPWALRRKMSWSAQAFELARDCANLVTRFDPLLRSAFKVADRIYVTSRDSLRLVPAACREKCVVQLAIGISRRQLGFSRRKIPSYGPQLRCLYVGRLLEWKGLHLALLAVQRAAEQGVPVHLTLIGDGPARRGLQLSALQLGVAEQIEWIPWLPHDEVQRLFHQHHVFLFPSLRDSGGMAMLEALAHGLPVVCTDLGGPGVIATNRCGRVVSTAGKTNDAIANEIARHLQDLARNPGLLEGLSIHARRRAWDFEFERVVEAIYGVQNPVTCDALAEAVLS